MNKKSFAFVLAVICLVSAVSAHAGLIEESVSLERSYVPALALTNQRDKPSPVVEESMRRLVAAWDKFIKGVSSEDLEKPALKDAIAQSSVRVKEAQDLVVAGKRIEAHEALETVRMVFWKTRVGMGIDYLPDRFTAFHEPMEEFAVLASKPETDISGLKARLQVLSHLWRDVEDSGLDVRLFGVSPERATKYAEQVRKVREILAQLEGFIASSNHEALARSMTAMKGNFAQTYFVFGDFSDLQ